MKFKCELLIFYCFINSFLFANVIFNNVESQKSSSGSFAHLKYDSFSTILFDVSVIDNSVNANQGKLSSEILVYPSPCPSFRCYLGFRVINGHLSNLNLNIFNMQGVKIIDTYIDAKLGYNKINLFSLVPAYPGTGMYYIFLFDSDYDLLEKTKFAAISL